MLSIQIKASCWVTFYYFTISRLRRDASKNLFIITIQQVTSHGKTVYRPLTGINGVIWLAKHWLKISSHNSHHNGDGSRWICSFEVNTTEVRYSKYCNQSWMEVLTIFEMRATNTDDQKSTINFSNPVLLVMSNECNEGYCEDCMWIR